MSLSTGFATSGSVPPPARAGGGSRATRGRGAAAARRWLPVVLLAALLAFADGFWLTSLRGAIGAIERTQSPFAAWWQDSALVLPVFVAAVAVPLRRAGRRRAAARGRSRAVLTTGLLVTAMSTAVGVGWAAVTSMRDYRLQARLLEERATLHADLANGDVHSHTGHALTLVQIVQERQATLATHVLGVEQASVILLVTNLVLVAWFTAARGGRLRVESGAAQPVGR